MLKINGRETEEGCKTIQAWGGGEGIAHLSDGTWFQQILRREEFHKSRANRVLGKKGSRTGRRVSPKRVL